MTLSSSEPTKIQKAILSLNPAQQAAVQHSRGPAVVFAGAGSGKTRVIVTRIARLIFEENISPWQILAVTFTNKAAREMRERTSQLVLDGGKVLLGTFHSVCARWLREFATELGFTSQYSIYDDKDSLQSIKACLANLGPAYQNTAPEPYKECIEKAKSLGVTPAQAHYLQLDGKYPEDWQLVYRNYQAYLASCNAMDFSDLLLNMLLLLRTNERVKKLLKQRYKHILVDEYQDTNRAQFELIKELVNEEGNLFVVGDDDQSIYSWRGADPANILGFKEQFPNAVEVRLEQNYRSSANIVEAASYVIGRNKKRAQKTLWTENQAGSPLLYQEEYDGEMEGVWVVQHIEDRPKGMEFQDIAIFYRTNAQSRIIEDALRKAQIPYRIYGSLKFYDRMEIKDLIAYFRLMVNPYDAVAFKRIINIPTRGLGKKAVEDLEALCRESGRSLWEECLQLSGNKVAAKFKVFSDMVLSMKAESENLKLPELLPLLLRKTLYREHLEKKFPEDAEDKIANIHELGAALAEYSLQNPQASLGDWIKDLSLREGEKEEDKGGVSLMTLHLAKGLEFRTVFIIGVEDGLIPYQHRNKSDTDLEEERRLFYVGMTRARENLFFVSAKRRRMFDRWSANPPSRFLSEIPLKYFAPSMHSPSVSGDSMQYVPEPSQAIVVKRGAQVRHPSYGSGIVEDFSLEFGVTKAVVNFSDFGLRKVKITHLS